MGEVEPMKIDGAGDSKAIPDGPGQTKKTQKRKRMEACLYIPNPEEREAKIKVFSTEIQSLVKFCKEKLMESHGALLEQEKVGSPASLNGVIACLMEESDLPLSKLVDDIFDEVKGRGGNGDGVSKAIVKSSILKIGQRLCYGLTSADADILEDEAKDALWCWETRELKLIPKFARATLKVRRTCRKKIQERIMAVSAMIIALEKSENHQELAKASEKLSKVLNEADIQLLMENISHKNGSEMAEKEAKREKLLIKQMEKSKWEMEKERKKVDRELQKEKLQSEREQKRLHDEAEKERRRREKEENEMQKKLKKQQEEAERCQRRREKEDSELRNQLALQKQASLMERFLKRNKSNSSSQNASSMLNETTSVSSSNNSESTSKSVTLSMDSVLAQNGGVEVEDIWRSHLNAWQSIGRSHLTRKVHWGIRQKPKTELIKELKLTTNKEVIFDEDLSIEKLVDGWADSNMDGRMSQINTDNSRPLTSDQKRPLVKQLLQFDKSHRPAFYGVWPRKSKVVRPRHPFVKDSDIDYEVDSDEEWEEDEPGESLSDCDKDEEDENMEEPLKDEDEDEDEDGFFVPDGYLSENEGLKDDEIESDDLVEEERSQSSSEQHVQSEEFCSLLQQQKHLNSLTEHALKKNQPLIILNFMNQKSSFSPVYELTGAEKLERICLQALSVRPYPGFSDSEISILNDMVNDDEGVSSYKLGTQPPETAATILDSDLPKIVSTIQAAPNSIRNIVNSLRTQFPSVPKSQLRKKVGEISEFSDNRWQVKKEILSKLGLPISPEKRYGKVKSIATYLKRCLPPSGKTDLGETPPKTSQRPASPHQSSLEHQ